MPTIPRIEITREAGHALKTGLKVAAARLTEVTSFARKNGLSAQAFDESLTLVRELSTDIQRAVLAERENYGQMIKYPSGTLTLSEKQRLHLKAAMELSARNDERLTAENASTMPAELVHQLQVRTIAKRQMLTGEDFDHLDAQPLLETWGMNTAGVFFVDTID